MRSSDRSGLSRLDVLIIVGVIALIFINAVPAIRVGVETARRYQCANNLRQLGTALDTYHDTHEMLPPATTWNLDDLILNDVYLSTIAVDLVAIRALIKSTRTNWVISLLPHLGEEQLWQSIDQTVSITDPLNAAARTTEFALMKCPSDDFNRPDNHYEFERPDGKVSSFARGNYAINGGSHCYLEAPGNIAIPVPSGFEAELDRTAGIFRLWGNGIAGMNTSFSYKDFTNGLSTTVAVEEIRAGIVSGDQRGAWAMGQIGSSITWGHGINGDAFGPNNQWKQSDDVTFGTALHQEIGREVIEREEMPFCDHCDINFNATARSKHPGGVNVLMMDGSVHFVSDDIDMGLWHVMHSRKTPADILAGDFEAKLSETNGDEIVASENADPIEISSGRPGQTMANSIDMQFVLLPAGEFTMGLPNKGNTREFPKEAGPHKVRISKPFYLGVYEVTQQQFEQVMGKNPSKYTLPGDDKKDADDSSTADYPVEQVTWYDADEFCRRLSALPEEKAAGRVYRLPTEAEWEYGCRSGSTEPYPFNQKWEDDDDSGELAGKEWRVDPPSVTPVGSYRPNRFGLHDMRGNVFEWCADWFERGYYSRSPVDDPQGPAHGYLNVVRGWDWRFIGPQCNYDYMPMVPWQISQFIGFRVVCKYKTSDGRRPDSL